MIIDDAHQVAFVHIPKCGGTSVRRQLGMLDSYDGRFYGREDHEDLGPIDYCHLPLAFLQTHFPTEFDKVATYRSFALVRDPHARFASATFERLALFSGVARTSTTGAMAIAEAERVMRWLETRDRFCDAAYIHFARQIDYVAIHDEQIVGNIYALDDISGFGAMISQLTGVAFDSSLRENLNIASPNRLLSLIKKAKPAYGRISTPKQREAIVKLMYRWKLQSPDAFYAEFREHPLIRSFVECYYEKDFAIYNAARARIGAYSEPTQPPFVRAQPGAHRT